jgi:hypothetical protein
MPHPSEAVARGKAPKMQVQLLNAGEPTKQYAVIFYQRDEAFSGLSEFSPYPHGGGKSDCLGKGVDRRFKRVAAVLVGKGFQAVSATETAACQSKSSTSSGNPLSSALAPSAIPRRAPQLCPANIVALENTEFIGS